MNNVTRGTGALPSYSLIIKPSKITEKDTIARNKRIFEETNLLMLNRSFPLSNDQSIGLKLLLFQGFLSVDHLVRLGRVLDDPGTRLRRQLLGRFSKGHSQIAPVTSYSLLVRLKPDESPFSQLGPASYYPLEITSRSEISSAINRIVRLSHADPSRTSGKKGVSNSEGHNTRHPRQ